MRLAKALTDHVKALAERACADLYVLSTEEATRNPCMNVYLLLSACTGHHCIFVFDTDTLSICALPSSSGSSVLAQSRLHLGAGELGWCSFGSLVASAT